MSTDSGFWFGQGEVFYSDVATQSCRFDDGSGAYLERDPTGAGNRKMWTTSMWYKRTELGGNHYLLTSYGPANNDGIAALYFQADQIFTYYDTPSATPYGAVGPSYFRDPNAWYHIVWAVDAANTIHKIWVNNVLISTDTNMYPPDYSYNMNNTEIHRIGEAAWGLGSYDMDGYLSHFVHIDGQYLEPDSFAEYKEGVWIPKDTSGLTFGTNGFQLDFKGIGTSTSSGVVSSPTNIGDDSSGNNHHWTPVNLSTDDSNCPDCPENNFCTMNPLDKGTNSTAMTFSEGNLKIAHNSTGAWQGHRGAFAVSSGKWYYEVQIATRPTHTTQNYGIGFYNADKYNEMYYTKAGNLAFGMNGDTAQTYKDTATTGYGTAADADGETYMVALDADNGKIWFGLEGTWMASGDPAGDSNPSISSAGSHTWSPLCSSYAYNTPYGVFIYNFGQDGTFAGTKTAGDNADDNGRGNFLYDVPAGFLALCSANLPKPTIGPDSTTQADDHFEATLYTSDNIGSGGTQNVTNVNFQPDIVWLKNRDSSSTEHTIYDSTRTTGGNSYHIATSGSAAQVGANSEYGYLSAFNSNGFTLTGGSTNANYVNQGTDKYVAYNWKLNGGTTSSYTPTGASAAVTMQRNTTAGISMIKYTGTGTGVDTNDQVLGHGLQVGGTDTKPDMMIFKAITTYGSGSWAVWHKDMGGTLATDFLLINSTAGTASTSDNIWGGTSGDYGEPTTTLAYIGYDWNVNKGPNAGGTGNSSGDYIAYFFASVEGFSKFGSYVGNGSSNGTFVYTGFRPAWIVTKRTDSTGNWYINDTARSPLNPTDSYGDNLYAETDGSESGNGMDILSNGFKIRNADGSQNASGGTFAYMAFAEIPFKYANAR